MKRYSMKNIILLLLLSLSCNLGFSQSKIDKSKTELNSGSGSKPALTSSSGVSNSSGNNSKCNTSDEDCGVFETIVKWVFCGVYYGFIGDYKSEDHLDNTVTDYPYYNQKYGNYERFEMIDSNKIKKNFRFDLQNNFLYSGKDLYGNHLMAKIRPFEYFYIQTDYHQLFEKNEMAASTDKLALFYFTLGYDRIRFKKANLGWTIGASYVGNEVKKAGFSVGVNTEFFIGHNISLLASAKWSGINGKPVNVYELESKYHLKRYFVSLGYQHLKIASPTYNFVSAGGGVYLN